MVCLKLRKPENEKTGSILLSEKARLRNDQNNKEKLALFTSFLSSRLTKEPTESWDIQDEIKIFIIDDSTITETDVLKK